MEIFARASQFAGRSQPAAALVTVVQTRGSVPRHAGAHMLVSSQGAQLGTIGGGAVELEVSRIAMRVARSLVPERVVRHLVRDLAMCCGGTMEFFIQPVTPAVLEVLGQADRCRQDRRSGILSTRLADGEKRVEEGRLGVVTVDTETLREPIEPVPRLFLMGAGHVARAIAPVAESLGFTVIVCDDNETGALDGATWIQSSVASFSLRDIAERCGGLGLGDFLIIATRDHAIDEKIVAEALANRELEYTGLIGSQGKIGRFYRRWKERCFEPETWSRLTAPIGLDIGAETPQEIAVAVCAQLVSLRRRGMRAAG